MSRKSKKDTPTSLAKQALQWLRSVLIPKRTWARRLLVGMLALIFLFVGGMYGVAQWYIASQKDKPLTFGATFVPSYARSFDLDPQATFDAMIHDLGIRRFRLVSYWKDIERTPGVYNFDELDWQFAKAEAAGAEISLAIGLRQPRWPECHGPDWAMKKPMIEWKEDLKVFMGKVIDRYKDSPALKEYQLENEFFLSVFGECPDFTRERLVDEYNFVKARDPNHRIVISRSNNAIGLPVGEPTPDVYAVSIYKRVWDRTITRRYYEYPFPAWFYASLAGGSQILQGRDLFIHELQTEAWLPPGFDMKTAPIEELYKSLSPERMEHRINYGIASGMRTIDLWGVEWWYHMKTERGAPELWDTAKKFIVEHRND